MADQPAAGGEDALGHLMPWTSSGEVSLRTRMTFSPRSAASAASSAVKYTRPTAAPGDARQALGDHLRVAACELRVQHLVEVVGGDAHARASAWVIFQPRLLGHVDGHAQRGGAGALADAGLQHPELALLDGELGVAHVAVVRLEPGEDRRAARRGSSGSGRASASRSSVLRMPATTSSPCALTRKSP